MSVTVVSLLGFVRKGHLRGIKMRLIEVGGVRLDEPLFLADAFSAKKNTARSDFSIDGSEIIFESEAKFNNLFFTHKDTAWQGLECLNSLILLANSSLGVVLNIKTDLGELKARFDYTQSAVSAQPLHIGSDKFLVEVNLKEVK